MFKAAVGQSSDIETTVAIQEVLKTCEAQLDSATPTAGLLFSANVHEPRLALDTIYRRYPDLQLVGCTTDGEMTASDGFSEESISLVLFSSDEVKIQAGFGKDASGNPENAAKQAVAQATSDLDQVATLAIALPDGMTTNAFLVLQHLTRELGSEVSIVGGMSADQVIGDKDHFETSQFCNNSIASDALPILLFSGPLYHSLGMESGWKPIGEKMKVTRSEGHLLCELDGKPPLEVYRHYLGEVSGDDLSGLGAYPLAVYEEHIERYYLRVPAKADPDTGHINFLGDIPNGSTVQITQAIREEILEAAQRSFQSALDTYPGTKPAVSLLFSCTGRKLALGSRTQNEIDKARQNAPKNLPMCGFYTFGEIGPLSHQTQARYHNTTFLTLLMGTS